MEVIFNHHLQHQREIIDTIGRARRKWKRLYDWFPAEQRQCYQKMDHIYKQTLENYNKELFLEYSQERRLNKRIIKRQHQQIHDKEYFAKFPCLKPILDKFNRFPLLYYDEACGSANYCEQ